MTGHILEKTNSLLDGKERTLLGIDPHTDDEFREDFASAFDDVEMAQVHRIEHTGIDGRGSGGHDDSPG
jgi:hypothetical protein